MRFAGAAFLGFFACLAGAPSAPAQEKKKGDNQAQGVSYSKDVAPILKASCGSCHDAKNKKGKLDLSSYNTLKKGGDGGAGFVAGDPDKSPIVKEISGDKPAMPKKKDPLKKDQVDLIAKWIKEGAKNN